jgi:hypothetical protein
VPQGDLTTLANVREFLRLTDATQNDMDALLSSFITQASDAIKDYCGREFKALSTASQARVFEYRGNGMLYFAPYDLQTCTSIVIDTHTTNPTTLTANEDYYLKPRNKDAGVWEGIELVGFEPASRSSLNVRRPWREVTVTGVWGFPTVPDAVRLACNQLVAWLYRQHSTVPGNDLAAQGDRYGAVLMPTSVLALLARYRVQSFAVGL